MSYKTLEHATDAIIEVTADNLVEAFQTAGISVIETILDSSKVDEIDSRKLLVKGKDLKYLLYNWLEEIIILTITEGFAGKRISIDILRNENYEIHAEIFVSLNGRPSQLFVDKKHDLTKFKYNLYHRKWIEPFQE